MILVRLVVALLLIPSAAAATLKVRVLDASGAPFPKVLVIVKSLDGGGEVLRELTDANGRVSGVDGGDGLYRVIATCPYGLCGTAVREFLGARLASELVITVPLQPSDMAGELLGAPTLRVALKLANGRPASGAHLLVRDPKAEREKWYVADERGAVTIELPSDPVVLVAVHEGAVFSLQVQTGCSRGAGGQKCTQINSSRDLTWPLY